MWIFLSIVAFLALIITVILYLPVYVIVKSDENGELMMRYRFLFKTYGEEPDPNNPIVVALKKATGVDNLEKEKLKSNAKRVGVKSTAQQTFKILMDLLAEIGKLLKYCTAKKFQFRAVISGEDAAEAAIHYGECAAAVYPLAGALSSAMRVKKRGFKIDLSCDFTGREQKTEYDFLIKVYLCHVLAALIRVSYKEAKREIEAQNGNQAPSNHGKNR